MLFGKFREGRTPSSVVVVTALLASSLAVPIVSLSSPSPVAAAPTVSSASRAGAAPIAALRFRDFGAQGGQADILLGREPGTSPQTSVQFPGATPWASDVDYPFVITWEREPDPMGGPTLLPRLSLGLDTPEPQVDVAAEALIAEAQQTPPPWQPTDQAINVIEIGIWSDAVATDPASVTLSGVTVNGEAVPSSLTVESTGDRVDQRFVITGFTASPDAVVAGTLRLTGGFRVSAEASKVEVTFRADPPPIIELTAPASVAKGVPFDVTARVDDPALIADPVLTAEPDCTIAGLTATPDAAGTTLQASVTCSSAGVASIGVTADDGLSPASSTAEVSVVNQPPGVSLDASSTTVDVGGDVTLTATVTDPDDGDDTLSCVFDPGDGTAARDAVVAAGVCAVTVTYTAVGSVIPSVVVTDGDGATATDSVAIAVETAAEPGPVDPGPVDPGVRGVVASGPARLLDTRPETETTDGEFAGVGRLDASDELSVEVSGRGEIPIDAHGVFVNVAVIRPASRGFVTVYNCADDRPLASSGNFASGVTQSNASLVDLSSGASVCVYSSAAADITVDAIGYLPVESPTRATGPARLLDTRDSPTVDGEFEGYGRADAGDRIVLHVAGRADVPDDARAVYLNVAVINADERGFVTVDACNDPLPVASAGNFEAGATVSGPVLVDPDADGNVCVFVSQAADVAVDVSGYVPADGVTSAVEPARLLDTRTGKATADGVGATGTRLAAGQTIKVAVAGRGGVDTSARAAFVTVAAVRPGARGFVTIHSCDDDRPVASSGNFEAGVITSNATLVQLESTGAICVFTSVGTDLTIDVTGQSPG
jgi:hypothetical protein